MLIFRAFFNYTQRTLYAPYGALAEYGRIENVRGRRLFSSIDLINYLVLKPLFNGKIIRLFHYFTQSKLSSSQFYAKKISIPQFYSIKIINFAISENTLPYFINIFARFINSVISFDENHQFQDFD